MSRVSNLFRLQEIDLELLDSQARIDEIDLILGQDEDLRKAKSLLEDQEGIMSEARSAKTRAPSTLLEANAIRLRRRTRRFIAEV
jgi:hypothetical protein